MFNELTHCTTSVSRCAIALALMLAFVLCSMPSAFAQTVTGTIQGTITSSQGNTKLAGVQVSAVAPSGRYAATTDQNGFFTINGVTPDTYTITFSRNGYAEFALQGVTVVQGGVANASSALNPSALTNIGRTQSRNTGGAFQPAQTTDQYNVNTQQINTTLGKSGGNNEANLLAAIPGASFDATGYPVLRGGREYEEGFEFEGIDYTDAFTHQFVNSLILNGAGNFQVQPGAGDASIGNAGTGAINVIAKRGTNPAFGQLEGAVYGGRFGHELRGEYGWATPNGRFSDYASLYFQRDAYHYGASGVDPLSIDAFFLGRTYQWANDVVNNFVYKWGPSNSQSLQFFYQNTQFDLRLGNGVVNGTLPYKDNDALVLANAGVLGLTPAQLQAMMPFTQGQRSLTDRIGSDGSGRTAINGNQPNETIKLQYSNNLDATTFLTAKYYRVNNVELFDKPYNGTLTFPLGDEVALQGGQRTGFALDGTKQLGSKNLLGFGGKYDFLLPVFSFTSATFGAFTYGGAANSLEAADFFTPQSCPAFYQAVIGNGPASCGYITQFMTPYRVAGSAPCPAGTFNTPACPLAVQVPTGNDETSASRQDWALYVKDTYSPTDRLKLDVGLRLDAVNWRYGDCSIYRCLPTSYSLDASGMPTNFKFDYDQDTKRPRVIQPRAAIAFQATRNDALRFSYGRSVQFPPMADVENATIRSNFNAFNNIPSRDPITGKQAMFCSTAVILNPAFQNAPCASYADQLNWENSFAVTGVPITPLKPVTFNNYDFSYSHLFPHQLGLKLTPFYYKTNNEVATTAQQLVQNGVPAVDPNGNPIFGPSVNTNLGKTQASGVEMLLTKEAAYGLSGSLSLTYQNVFSNVVPTSASENFFPSIPPESLALGNLYRVGYLSPFVGALAIQERTRTGWRINPVIYYNHGYPYGSGLITATTVNGKPFNVPNTNVTSPAQLGGPPVATSYVDPRNPGSVFNPNVDATRGTPETASAGGVLSAARFTPVQLTVEYTSPRNPRAGTVGLLVFNLFNQLYAEPALNSRYQAVATGIAGPYSGYTSAAAFTGVFNVTPGSGGNRAYFLFPNNIPRTVQLYYQVNL
ncbi:MAG TPA: TonB-dependent receptor [Candidatus Elarobacter sp.]|nr:TonB-dependent receptor [Candidatus Elarobacter sp.]